MDNTRDTERKPLWRICGVMVILLVGLVGVISWQLKERQTTVREEEQKVIDVTPPIFTEYLETVELTPGTAFDLLAMVQAADETDEEVEVEILGEYDSTVPGEYELEYVARDRSGNQTRQKVVVRVVDGETGGVWIVDRTFVTEKGLQAKTVDGITFVDGVLIANKTYNLPEDYGEALTEETLAAFEEMQAAAASEGLDLRIVSGFRSFETQRNLYNRYVARDGFEEAETYSARPGFSEHQTGLAMDLNLADSSFADTAEGQWLAQHAWKYGFILRYPNGKTEITGYIFEPWHFRFVGQELATELYNGGDWISLEEYFGIESRYVD